jgi:hypothetical protein
MTSRAIYGHDLATEIDKGLAPEQFTYRFLAEGDSWMDRSSTLTASLPDYLTRAWDQTDESVLIINLAIFGDTMRHIGESVSGEFGGWVEEWAFDAILLSAGGNDFIDAARDPDAGQGILRNMAGQALPASGYDCVDQAAVTTLVDNYLNPNFKVLYDAVRASAKNKDAPIFLNSYCTPVARNAPATHSGKAWLYEAYTKNGIDASLWPALTDGIFDDLRNTLDGWAQGRDKVFNVPTNGALIPATKPSGNSEDWINEIHPNARGWKKLAAIWRDTVRAQL